MVFRWKKCIFAAEIRWKKCRTKAKSAKAKSSKTVLAHPEKYHVKHIVKFGDYNVGREGQLLTLPTYMQFLLDLEPEELVLEPINADSINSLAREILTL